MCCRALASRKTMTKTDPLTCYGGTPETTTPTSAAAVAIAKPVLDLIGSGSAATTASQLKPIFVLTAKDPGAYLMWTDASTSGNISSTKALASLSAMISNGFPPDAGLAWGTFFMSNEPVVPRASFYRSFTETVARPITFYAICMSPCFLYFNGASLGMPYSPFNTLDGVTAESIAFHSTTQVGANLINIISHSYPEATRYANSTNGVYGLSFVVLSANVSAGDFFIRTDGTKWYWTTDSVQKFSYASDTSLWCETGFPFLDSDSYFSCSWAYMCNFSYASDTSLW